MNYLFMHILIRDLPYFDRLYFSESTLHVYRRLLSLIHDNDLLASCKLEICIIMIGLCD